MKGTVKMEKHPVLSGIDRIATVLDQLDGKRVGLMTNPTGINHALQSTIDILNASCRLTALFAVEHGIRGDAQAGAAVESTDRKSVV